VVALKSLLPDEGAGFFDGDDDFSASLFAGETLIARTEALCVGASGLKGEYGRLREFSVKEGRKLSNARRARVQTVRDSLGGLLAELDGLLTETEPAPRDDAARETARLQTEFLRRQMTARELIGA
jgi:hypothetical protein